MEILRINGEESAKAGYHSLVKSMIPVDFILSIILVDIIIRGIKRRQTTDHKPDQGRQTTDDRVLRIA